MHAGGIPPTGNLHTLTLFQPAMQVGGHEFYAEDVVREMEALLDGGKSEEMLVLFLTGIADFTRTELDALRDAPNWSVRVDAAHTILRGTWAEQAYTFDPGRFREMITPTLLLSGSESPEFLRAATAAVAYALRGVGR